MATSTKPLIFKVTRKPHELLKPAKPTPHDNKLLSDIDDQEGLRFQIPVIQFYQNDHTQVGKDPVKIIREAIKETPVFYYPFAGRLREVGPGRKLLVECTGEGVEFIEADVDVTLEQFGDALQLPFPCLEELLYVVPGCSGVLDSPLLLIQVTRLRCGGFIFALRLNHTMSDAPGLVRFTNEIGSDYTKQTLESSITFIWSVFQQSSDADRKNVDKVDVFIDTFDGISYTVSNELHFSANYINGYSGDLKKEITGVLYHEMTHIWQWNGNGNANGGLIKGIADYVRLKASYAPSHWVMPGQGDRWDQGYDVTARFLDYCTSLDENFVAQLNKKMRDGYSNDFFIEILGNSVDQLWSDYKAKYMN